MLLRAGVYRFLFEFLLSILLGLYPTVEFRGPAISRGLVSRGAAMLPSTVAAPCSTPTGDVRGLRFLHLLTRTCDFLLIAFVVVTLSS